MRVYRSNVDAVGLDAVRAAIDNTRDEEWSDIHGDATRIHLDISKFSLMYAVSNSATRFWSELIGGDYDPPILVSSQILRSSPNTQGQYLHFDTIKQYVIVVVTLQRSRSTMFLNVAYSDTKTPRQCSYPSKWQDHKLVSEMLDPGDVVCFFSNAPHAGLSYVYLAYLSGVIHS